MIVGEYTGSRWKVEGLRGVVRGSVFLETSIDGRTFAQDRLAIPVNVAT